MQIKELESRLEALNAAFGREDEESAAAQRKERGASMRDRFTPREAEFPTQLGAPSSTDEAIDPLLASLEAFHAQCGREDEESAAAQSKQTGASIRFTPREAEFPTQLRAPGSTDEAINPSFHHPAELRPPLGRRVLRSSARLLIIFCVGVCSTLAWQSYGDAAGAKIAESSPQLGWLAPQPTPVIPTIAEAAAPAAAPSPEVQQLAFGLAAIRQSVDRLTTQLASGQQQMRDEIAKLGADEQEILRKLSATAPKPTASQAHKPTPVAAAAPPPASAQAR